MTTAPMSHLPLPPATPPSIPRPPSARLVIALALCLGSSGAFAADPPTRAPSNEELARRLQALEQRYGVAPDAAVDDGVSNADLDQRMRILERRLELADEAATAKAATTPTIVASTEKGLSVKSPSGDLDIKLRGLVQADGRFFLDDGNSGQNDTFLFRRIRPTLEGSYGKLIGFRLTPEFAGDSATIVDAYVDLKFDPRATVRIGKVKGPVGLERLQGGGSTALVERGFPTELAPNRDIGVQLQGEFGGGTLTYVAGVYNGTVDGRDAITANPDDEFEFAGRVFAEPWKNSGGALAGLGVGIAGSAGDTRGAGNNFLPRYRTPGQAQFFNYRSTVVADGSRTRWSPQGYYYRGTFGLLAEYIRASQDLFNPANGARATVDNRAWQAVGTVVLTGEDASYRGVVRPNHPFTVGAAGWGAFEVAARVGRLEIDDAAFPLFADANAVASAASSWGLGVNWYLTNNLKLVADYTQTRFDDGIAGADRGDEKAFLTRAQFSF